MATTASDVLQGQLFIGGEWQDSASGSTFASVNPATGETLAEVAEARAEDVDRAAHAARRAFAESDWATMSARDRGRILLRIADLIEERLEELARLETLDNGKPFHEARRFDIPDSAACFRYYGGLADKISGEVLPIPGPFLNYTRREPIGVCGQIIPWNFPFQMAAWKVAPALACGNTVVLKPAEETPLTALELGRIAAEAGLPAGVLNIVPGFGEVAGAALVAHPEVDKIAFTGSTEVGRKIQREAANSLKQVTLELGGKSPNIVFADADLEAAVRGASSAIFYNAGQACTAGARLLVEESIHGEFLEKLVKWAEGMRPGDPFGAKCRMGPLVSREQLERVTRHIEIAKEEGARLVIGGERADVHPGGFYLNPTIFDQVKPEMAIAREEVFGPVLAVSTFATAEEAVELGNRSEYGLAAGVWTRDVAKAHRVAHELRAGTVWINMYHRLDTGSPFGGYKQSGYGRELGPAAIEMYTQTKSVWVSMK